MDEKSLKRMPEKHDAALNNMDTVHGVDTSSLVLYDSLIGVKNTINMMKAVIVLLSITSLATTGALFYKTVKNPFVPYVVRISESGAINGQVISGGNTTIDNSVMQFFLSDFIKKVRTITVNRADYQKQSADKLAFLTPNSKTRLETLFGEVTDTKDILQQSQTTEVVIDSFLPLGNNQYQINYSEIVMSQEGTKLRQNRYTMVLTVSRTEVKGTDMVEKNPLGILITDVQLSKVKTDFFNQQPIQQPTQQMPVQQQPVQQAPVQQTVPQQQYQR